MWVLKSEPLHKFWLLLTVVLISQVKFTDCLNVSFEVWALAFKFLVITDNGIVVTVSGETVFVCFSGETSLPAFHPVVVLLTLTDSGESRDLWCIKGSVEMIDCRLTQKESSLHSWKPTEQHHSSSSSKDDARGRRGGDLVWSGRTAWQWKEVVMGLGLGSTLHQDPGPVSLLLCSCECACYIFI